MFGPCFVMQCLVSFLVLHSPCLVAWLLSSLCLMLPHCAMGQSVFPGRIHVLGIMVNCSH